MGKPALMWLIKRIMAISANQGILKGLNMGRYIKNDGGRAFAGYKGIAGDCVCRALAIALDVEYKQMYKKLANANKEFGDKKSARDGVHQSVYEKILKEYGFFWIKAPVFVGRKARTYDLPKGRYIAKQAGHLVAVIDGVAHDIFDCTERMVYGYWGKK